MQESSPEHQGSPLLIDESLADVPLAQALRLIDYNAIAVTEQLGHGVDDPTLMQWLGLQAGVWVTADERAKREHSDEIARAGIHIIWVHRPKTGMSKRAQLLLLLWILDPILEAISRARVPTQFLAKYSGARPKWERL